MGKRKRSRSRDREYEKIYKKLKKLASKSRKRRRSRSLSTSDSGTSESEHQRFRDYNEYEDDDVDCPGTDIRENFEVIQPDVAELCVSSPVPAMTSAEATLAEPLVEPARPAAPAPAAVAVPEPLAEPGATEAPALPTSAALEENTQTESLDNAVPSLDPEILELLGDDPTSNKTYGENLHKDIALRWAHILTNGLAKNTQVDLVKAYLPPENCPNMRVPKLNLEIKAALLDINVKKDLYSQSKQSQLSSSLAAIGQVLNWALAPNNSVPQNIIKILSDAGRLISDSHYRESLSRRFTALNNVNKNMRDTIKNTKIDEHLFGSALSEHIKSSKAISKTGSEIKSVVSRPQYKQPAATATQLHQQRGALNSRGAPSRAAAAAEARPPPAPRRPPRDRRQEAPASRGRRSTYYSRQQTRRRY